MYTNLAKLFLMTGASSILAFSLIDTAFAISYNFSGRFGNNGSCSSTLVPREFLQCPIEGFEGRLFTGATATRESSNFVPANVSFGLGGNSRNFFLSQNISTDQNVSRLSLTNNFSTDLSEELRLSFATSDASSPSAPFGAFLGGFYSRDDGRNPRFSQSISIVEATITRAIPPVSIPEANTVPGILASTIICSWWLRRKF